MIRYLENHVLAKITNSLIRQLSAGNNLQQSGIESAICQTRTRRKDGKHDSYLMTNMQKRREMEKEPGSTMRISLCRPGRGHQFRCLPALPTFLMAPLQKNHIFSAKYFICTYIYVFHLAQCFQKKHILLRIFS